MDWESTPPTLAGRSSAVGVRPHALAFGQALPTSGVPPIHVPLPLVAAVPPPAPVPAATHLLARLLAEPNIDGAAREGASLSIQYGNTHRLGCAVAPTYFSEANRGKWGGIECALSPVLAECAVAESKLVVQSVKLAQLENAPSANTSNDYLFSVRCMEKVNALHQDLGPLSDPLLRLGQVLNKRSRVVTPWATNVQEKMALHKALKVVSVQLETVNQRFEDLSKEATEAHARVVKLRSTTDRRTNQLGIMRIGVVAECTRWAVQHRPKRSTSNSPLCVDQSITHAWGESAVTCTCICGAWYVFMRIALPSLIQATCVSQAQFSNRP